MVLSFLKGSLFKKGINGETMSGTIKLPTVTKFPPMPVCKPPTVEEEYEEFRRDTMKKIGLAIGLPRSVIKQMYKSRGVESKWGR